MGWAIYAEFDFALPTERNGRRWKQVGHLPSLVRATEKLWICEGGTDAAALLSLNCFAIGRPSCSGGTDEINATIKRLGIKEAVIIADNDEDKTIGGRTYNPGADGAMGLLNDSASQTV